MTAPSVGLGAWPTTPTKRDASVGGRPESAIDSGVSQWLQQNSRLLFALLFLTVGFFNWLIRTLAKQAAEKKSRDRRQEAETEALRTGRPMAINDAVTPELSAARRLEELAERRRQQLDELRRRAAAKVGMGAPSDPPPADRTPRPAAASSSRPTPQPPARRTGPINPQQATARAEAKHAADLESRRVQDARTRREGERQQRATEQKKAGASARVQAQDRASAADASRLEDADDERRQSYDAIPTRATTGSVRIAGASEWRRAMVLREVLGPPVSMRESDDAMGELA